MNNSMTVQKVAFVGVGRMGGPMAINAQNGGFTVAAFDTQPALLAGLAEQGVRSLASLAQACAFGEALVLMLPSDEALQAVVEGPGGLLEHLRADQLVIDMSTSKLATSQRLAQRLAATGAQMLDAPVSGGVGGALAASLSIMVGGDKTAFERALPLFKTLGTTITHVGGNGLGLVTKFVNQTIMEATFCAVGEAFGMAAKAGADLDLVFQAVRNGHAGSRVLEMMIPALLADELGEGRELTLHSKDGSYALAAAASLDAQLPITEVSHRLFAQAMDAGLGVHSAAAIAKLFMK